MFGPIWQVEVDSSTPTVWSEMLDLFNDANIYQTWSYGRVRWGEKHLSHLVLKRNGEVVGMAQLRIIRPTRLKFGLAYLRWGPLCERRGRPLDPEAVAKMSSALEEEYVRKRRLLLQILPNAFAGSPRADVFQFAFSGFECGGSLASANSYRTFLLDLNPPLEELRKRLDPKWRNKLTQSERKGLRVVAGSGPEEFRAFCRLYYEMRKRKTFDTSVDLEEFARIQEDLPESHRMQVLICEEEGVPVTGAVCSAIGDSAIYLLGATGDKGLTSKGAYLLQWNLIHWLKDRGVRTYDLGGIDPVWNPGVYSFKRGIAGADVLQMAPMVACNGVLSAAFVKAGLAMRRRLSSVMGRLRAVRSLKDSVDGSKLHPPSQTKQVSTL
jgi:lipid II:glycine glycyltransferase (peptidoglycan interpeptide bridge formation enzyme)